MANEGCPSRHLLLGEKTAAMQLLPSFVGYIRNEADAHLVFANVRAGLCPRAQRRFNRHYDAILPGTGYVYHEDEAAIQRWTDGLEWSDSYHPGGSYGNMIYKQVMKLADGKKVEMQDGLRKKTARCKYNDKLHLVAYYFDRDVNTYPPLFSPGRCLDADELAAFWALLSLPILEANRIIPARENERPSHCKIKRGRKAMVSPGLASFFGMEQRGADGRAVAAQWMELLERGVDMKVITRPVLPKKGGEQDQMRAWFQEAAPVALEAACKNPSPFCMGGSGLNRFDMNELEGAGKRIKTRVSLVGVQNEDGIIVSFQIILDPTFDEAC